VEIWKFIWILALAVAFVAFIIISSKVIFRGFAEMRDLLNNLDRSAPPNMQQE